MFRLLIATLCLCINICHAQTIDDVITDWENDEDLKEASYGVCIVNTDDENELLFNYNGDKTLKPASTLKAVTTATALGILGEEFRFETQLQYTGKIENGVLHGDLIIQGGGDPTLGFMRYDMGLKSSEILSLWTQAVKDAGINQIEGNVIGDPTFFDTQLISARWQWEDMGNYFGAGVSGLNFHENKYEIQFAPSTVVGQKAKITNINPPLDDFIIENEVLTGDKNSGDQAYIYAAPYSNTLIVRGTVPNGDPKFTIKGAVTNPALFTAGWLKKHLQRKGVAVSGKADFYFPSNVTDIGIRQTIHRHLSPPLKEIVYWANKKSINLYCEAMLKMMGLKAMGKASFEAGIRTVVKYWKNRKIDLRKALLYDGSGLSPSNAISPFMMSMILSACTKEKWFPTFYNSLSVACKKDDKGSMRNMLCNTPAAQNLKAKSGYIANTRCYVGYVHNKCGDLLSFAIMINNYTCNNSVVRLKIEKMMTAIANYD